MNIDGAFSYAETDRRRNGVQELSKLSRHDVHVAHFLAAWRNGGFSTFEEMLVQLAIHLVTTNQVLTKYLVKDSIGNPWKGTLEGRITETKLVADPPKMPYCTFEELHRRIGIEADKGEPQPHIREAKDVTTQ